MRLAPETRGGGGGAAFSGTTGSRVRWLRGGGVDGDEGGTVVAAEGRADGPRAEVRDGAGGVTLGVDGRAGERGRALPPSGSA